MLSFDFSVLTVQKLNSYLARCPSANWMQSWAYAKASHIRDFKSIRPAVIKLNSDPIGLMLIHEIKLGPIHFIDLKRGPLWFSTTLQKHKSTELLIMFSKQFDAKYPKRLLTRRRWLPEFEKSTNLEDILKAQGFEKRKETFSTVSIDLKISEAELRSKLKQKWRNCLNKSEKQNLTLSIENQTDNIDLFLKKYEEYKQHKAFAGPTSKFIQEEVAIAKTFQQLHILWAYKDQRPIAGMLMLTHGETVSYRIGWNTLLGRQTNAHYLMLWNAILYFKNLQMQCLDLGGILPDEQKDLTHFKLGLGHSPTEFIGMFC